MGLFQNTVSALGYSLAREFDSPAPPATAACYNDVVRFILRQQRTMPDYLRQPMRMATVLFGLTSVLRAGRCFHRLSPEKRDQQLRAWTHSRFSFCRDLVRFYQTLAMLGVKDREGLARGLTGAMLPAPVPRVSVASPSADHCEVAVVGSGPGGAITACLLSEAGRRVVLFEEGRHFGLDSCRPFTLEEILQKYREGGITVALGRSKIAYVEGRCVGGGSEINSGLYHRTPPEILERWRREFEVDGLTEADLQPHFESCERDVSVSPWRGAAPAASLKLHEGATRLGWNSLAVPRWFAYDNASSPMGQRQSMTQTYVPRALRAGCDLRTGARVRRLRWLGKAWSVEGVDATGKPVRVQAENVFVCGGAVQTPALLFLSGLTANIGRNLQLHPTVKIIAEFAEAVNFADMGVPVHQVKQFAPRLSFGCSISSPPFLGVGMLDHPQALDGLLARWSHAAAYYAMITPAGTGTVRPLPGFNSPLVRFRITHEDCRALADGLRKLAQLLFEAGAVRQFPGLRGGPCLRNQRDLERLPESLPAALTSLMTIHLFSSCPMGENRRVCGANSFGAVPGVKNLFVNDASLLCTAPGVNPQGSIMALARRNALKFLGKL